MTGEGSEARNRGGVREAFRGGRERDRERSFVLLNKMVRNNLINWYIYGNYMLLYSFNTLSI